MDKLMAECPFVKGNASGMAVGLPEGQMGNSEVGHLNMGAGRIVYQDLTKITKSIQDGDFPSATALPLSSALKPYPSNIINTVGFLLISISPLTIHLYFSFRYLLYLFFLCFASMNRPD